jgi:hypothetical protein
MEGFEFQLGQHVKINLNEKQGLVIGIWIDRQEIVQYLVQYTNDIGTVIEKWFDQIDLSKNGE